MSIREQGPNGLRVLVVEDDADTAQSMAMWLETLGHAPFLARTGPGAVDAARAQLPDVVLLDIALPGLDGYEVARQIRQLEAPRKPLLVAITGYGRDEDRRRAGEAGIDLHLLKPANLDHLGELLKGFETYLREGAAR